jgi:hypothetical protein
VKVHSFIADKVINEFALLPRSEYQVYAIRYQLVQR